MLSVFENMFCTTIYIPWSSNMLDILCLYILFYFGYSNSNSLRFYCIFFLIFGMDACCALMIISRNTTHVSGWPWVLMALYSLKYTKLTLYQILFKAQLRDCKKNIQYWEGVKIPHSEAWFSYPPLYLAKKYDFFKLQPRNRYCGLFFGT